MTNKYKMVRIPIEASLGFLNKKNVISEILKEEKIKKRWTMADTLRFVSQRKMFIYNEEIKDFLKNKHNKYNMKTRLI